jgi:glycosyltransferase involved in cell wall biosynthesis
MMTHLVGIFSTVIQPKLRLIVHMQTIISPRLAGGLGHRFFNAIIGRATRVVAVSKAVLEALPDSNRVVLVYNGADVAAFESIQHSSIREELGIAPNQPLVGVVGRLTPWKGHRVFLDAVHKLVQAGTPGHFIVVGDDIDPVTGESQYRPALEEYARSLNIQDRVIFTGFRKDIPNVMCGLDVLVIPSLRPDPSPLVAVEGMASGLPVVGSNSGGVAEVILDGQTGRLFPPGDSATLAAILQELIAHPALRARYGEAARQRVKDNFSLPRYTNALIDILRQISVD